MGYRLIVQSAVPVHEVLSRGSPHVGNDVGHEIAEGVGHAEHQLHEEAGKQ